MTTITFRGNQINTTGHLPAVGSQAPDFTLTKTDLSEIHLKNYSGKKILLNIFPSLDTKTCAAAMHKFNEIAKKHKELLILCVSADLPFAQDRFCSANCLINVQPASVFRHPSFGDSYGVTIANGPLTGLLSRAVVLINEKGDVTFTQQVDELSQEPNYPAILAAIEKMK